MLNYLLNYWWLIALRGLFAVIFGLAAFFWPGITLLILVILFGSYALFDGILTVVNGIANRTHRRWWVLLLEGFVSMVVGVLALAWPGITAIILLYLIATWAIVTGVIEIAAAIELRKEIKGEWALAVTGVLSIVLGIYLILNPSTGAVAVVLMIGAYAFLFGLLLLYLGLKLRSVGRTLGVHDADTITPAT